MILSLAKQTMASAVEWEVWILMISSIWCLLEAWAEAEEEAVVVDSQEEWVEDTQVSLLNLAEI